MSSGIITRPVPLYNPDPIAHAVELLRCGAEVGDVAEALLVRGAVDRLAAVQYRRSDCRWGHVARLRVAVQRLTIGRVDAIRIARALHPA